MPDGNFVLPRNLCATACLSQLELSRLPHFLCCSAAAVPGQFIYVIRKRIKLDPEKAIFIFVNDTIPQTCKSSQIESSLCSWFALARALRCLSVCLFLRAFTLCDYLDFTALLESGKTFPLL